MKKPAFLLVFVLFLFVPLAAAQFQLYSKGVRLSLPFTATVGDVVLQAGDYQVNAQFGGLRYVGRPSASMGFWPGPDLRLSRIQDAFLPTIAFRLTTDSEAKVIYDLPGEAERQQLRVGSSPSATPMFRGKELVGMVYEGQTLRIVSAQRLPHGRLRVLRPDRR